MEWPPNELTFESFVPLDEWYEMHKLDVPIERLQDQGEEEVEVDDQDMRNYAYVVILLFVPESFTHARTLKHTP